MFLRCQLASKAKQASKQSKMVENKEIDLTADEAELYDRQIRLWGLDSQKRLRAAKILLCGLNGVGAEIAKNVILAGIKSIVFLDHRDTSEEDSCAQFLIPVTAVGQNRAEASLQRARALNPMVEISADKEDFFQKSDDFFKNFDVVIVTGAATEQLIRIDNICRENKVKFFATDLWGMFGYSFEDLVDHQFAEEVRKYKIVDKDGNKSKTELVLTTKKSQMKFPPFKSVLEFDFTSEPYKKRMKKVGSGYVLLRVLQLFRDRFNRNPSPSSRDDDIKQLLEIRDEIAQGLIEDAAFSHVFSQIAPAAAVVGGQVAQEVINAVSQKGVPLRNVFLFTPDNCAGYIEYVGGN